MLSSLLHTIYNTIFISGNKKHFFFKFHDDNKHVKNVIKHTVSALLRMWVA